jgi:hypothetical protein
MLPSAMVLSGTGAVEDPVTSGSRTAARFASTSATVGTRRDATAARAAATAPNPASLTNRRRSIGGEPGAGSKVGAAPPVSGIGCGMSWWGSR